MSLKISRKINLKPEKIGRNDPCFCGSGKKYKKCCQKNVEELSSVQRKGQTGQVIDWLLGDPEFRTQYEKELDKMSKAPAEFSESYKAVMEALVFQGKTGRQTFLEYYIDRADLSDEERKRYQEWQKKSFLSIFTITGIQTGQSLTVKDIRDNEEYLILENQGTLTLKVNDSLLTRLIPLGDFWMISGGLSVVLPESDEIKYILSRNGGKGSKIDQLEIVEMFYGKKSHKKDIHKMSHKQAKSELSKLLGT